MPRCLALGSHPRTFFWARCESTTGSRGRCPFFRGPRVESAYRFSGAVPFLRGALCEYSYRSLGAVPFLCGGLVRSCHHIRASPSPTTPGWLLWSTMPAGSPSPVGGYSGPRPCGWLRGGLGVAGCHWLSRTSPSLATPDQLLLSTTPGVPPSPCGYSGPRHIVTPVGLSSATMHASAWTINLVWMLNLGARPVWLFSVKAGLQPPDRVGRDMCIHTASPSWDGATRDYSPWNSCGSYRALGASREHPCEVGGQAIHAQCVCGGLSPRCRPRPTGVRDHHVFWGLPRTGIPPRCPWIG